MKYYFAIIILAAGLILSSCSPNVSTKIFNDNYRNSVPANETVLVYNLLMDEPKDAFVVGSIDIDDTGFTVNCGRVRIMSLVKEEARKMGANAVKVTSLKEPDMISSCYRISAMALVVDKE